MQRKHRNGDIFKAPDPHAEEYENREHDEQNAGSRADATAVSANRTRSSSRAGPSRPALVGGPDRFAERLYAFLAALPRGLDTQVGEEGAQVSGGQRRRIALARAFLADARFLVLDEPTAHLDPAGARELLAALGADRTDGRGVLVISHTVEGLEGFDEIVVLDGGRVAERGAPAELLARGGAYAALVALA